MRKVLLGLFVLFFGLCGAANAVTINYNYALTANNNDFTSPYLMYAVTVQDFESTALGGLPFGYVATPATTGGGVVQGTLSGVHAAPFGLTLADETKYLSVPLSGSSGSVTVTVGGANNNYLGMWWGSMDTYNIVFFYGLDPVLSITGSQVADPSANGGQSGPGTNRYVNILDLPYFTSFTLTSNGIAFEVDNIAVGNVPEPATMLLLGSGLIGLAAFRKRFR